MKRVMGLAFERACMAFEIRDRDEKIVRLIASKIIELAMAGEVDPERLCERALNQLRRSRPLLAAMEKQQRAGASQSTVARRGRAPSQS
jgi:hypothetical protein